MTTTLLIFTVINVAACAVTCWYALCGLNACSPQTPFATRMSFAAIAVGSFAATIHPPDLEPNGVGTVLAFVGIAVGFLANRRQCVCLNCPARGKRKPAPMHQHERGGHLA
jgi:hypothetical protein